MTEVKIGKSRLWKNNRYSKDNWAGTDGNTPLSPPFIMKRKNNAKKHKSS